MGGPAYIDGKEYKEFDNFYPCVIEYWGIQYPTVEHAFQAQKNDSAEHTNGILAAKSPGEAWEIGNECELREDWEDVKALIMSDIVREKLKQHKDIWKLLMGTVKETHFFQKKYPKIVFKGSTPEWNDINGKIWEHWARLGSNIHKQEK